MSESGLAGENTPNIFPTTNPQGRIAARMLVLSRKKSESVKLFDEAHGIEITVTVVEIREGNVRIGFTAPECVRIAREEINGKASRPGQVGCATGMTS